MDALGENLFHSYLVHHKSYMRCPWIEPRYTQLEAALWVLVIWCILRWLIKQSIESKTNLVPSEHYASNWFRTVLQIACSEMSATITGYLSSEFRASQQHYKIWGLFLRSKCFCIV